jgi:hypothetical protein
MPLIMNVENDSAIPDIVDIVDCIPTIYKSNEHS